MATWHQMRNPCRLGHETKWTLVIDPPHKTMVLVLYDTEEGAKEGKRKSKEPAYIIKPYNLVQ